MSKMVLVEEHENWVKLTLNRPEKLNCLNVEMHIALRKALEKVESSCSRAILITGSGQGFCAGQDLGERNPDSLEWPPDLRKTLNEYFNPLIRLITGLKMPVVCAVNGVAAGAGANLALACDLTLAAESAKFIQAFSKIGLVPDAGGSWILPRRIGYARAMALALTGDTLSAKEAEKWGLIWKCFSDETLMKFAEDFTRRFASGPTKAFAHTKLLMQEASFSSLEEQLENEARAQQVCGHSEDYAEGIRAFLQKSSPRFKGR